MRLFRGKKKVASPGKNNWRILDADEDAAKAIVEKLTDASHHLKQAVQLSGGDTGLQSLAKMTEAYIRIATEVASARETEHEANRMREDLETFREHPDRIWDRYHDADHLKPADIPRVGTRTEEPSPS
jgi:hypothetical protein